MMFVLDLLRKRRSIRKFHDRPLTPDQISVLEEAALRSPSARNLRSWEFIFVEDRDLLIKLADTRGVSSAFIAGAALGVVIIGNEKTADTWVEDGSIAAIIIQLAASCWAHVRNREHAPGKSAEDYVRELLGIPDPLKVLCVIAVGYPAEEKPGIPKEELPSGKIFRNRYGQA
jgi:nitroreductase